VKGDRRIGTQVGQVLATGRPRAIPMRLIPELLQRRDRGEGYQNALTMVEALRNRR
jgi:hypothetical protein